MVEAWFRSGHPTRTELVAAVAALALVAETVLTGPELALSWLATGFVAFGLALGPGASTRAGVRIGEAFRSIAVAGRLAAIAGVAVLAWAASTVVRVPATETTSLAVGGLSAVVVYAVVESVYTVTRSAA